MNIQKFYSELIRPWIMMMNIATSANIIKSGLLSYTDTLNHVKTDVTVFNSDNFKNILKETVYRNNKNHNIAKKLAQYK